ncbi:DsbA family protein [Streptomyces sp. TLI_171]|uniref:DsbA family protein n=1 Tax=Streptomyces sp. TLI_171 TaxID=1938859 RepID=UPI000C177253|nr:DsbA family protein [Streptomyces sp. TLI_171]RKE23674.1 putative DsbA family dithiol-disulfide isomerase [Streptomyces sp. TLI_171]
MTGGPALEVVEYTDPFCPWAWGSEPVLRRLRRELDGAATHRRVFGILFDEDEEPAPDPAAETAWYAEFVARVSGHTGAPRPVRLRWVAASSWPASLAAAAAEQQGPEVAERVLRRLRESSFVRGEPADTPERIAAALHGVPGLDPELLAAAAASPAVRERVARDRAETRAPRAEVVGLRGAGPHPGGAKEIEDGYRYALPTLVFHGPAGCRVVPGWRGPGEYLAAARAVCPGLPSGPPQGSPDPAELLHRYRSLTAPEVPGGPPPGAVTLTTGSGPLHLSPDEAAVSPLLSHDAAP